MNSKFFKKLRRKEGFDLEEAMLDQSGRNFEILELPLRDIVFKFFGAAVIAFGVIVGGRVCFLGIANGNFYAVRALANMNKEVVIPAARGIIVDRYGTPLVKNTSAFDLYIRASEFLKNPENILPVLQKVLGMDEAHVKEVIGKSDLERSDMVLVAHDIGTENAILLRDSSITGISVEDSYRRNYPFSDNFAHIVGYVDSERKGRTGLEAYYETLVKGEDGMLLRHRNAHGEIIDEYEVRSAKSGATLHTTVDAELQIYFGERLSRGLRSIGRTQGAGLVLDPQNGEVLAMVSLPSFDSNLFTSSGNDKAKTSILASSHQPLFNRVISGVYSPGSTIKPLHALAALAEGVVDTEKSIFSAGYIELPNPYNPENPSRFVDWKAHGWVNLYSALARSSNVYFYEIGGGFEDVKGLGIEKLMEWWNKFRLAAKTGIDMPGEKSGVIPDPEEKQKRTGQIWRIGDTYNVSIGQGDLRTTPLQLLSYISAIANGGKIYRPHINSENVPSVIADLSGFSPQINEVQRGMKDAVDMPYGTAYLLHDLPIEVAAKTGSAQIQNNAKTNAFFVGYMPANNPEIAILVLVEDAKEGSLNAVPIARDVLSWYYEHRIAGSGANAVREAD